MKKLSKIFVVILALAMLLSFSSVGAFAATDDDEWYYYEIDITKTVAAVGDKHPKRDFEFIVLGLSSGNPDDEFNAKITLEEDEVSATQPLNFCSEKKYDFLIIFESNINEEEPWDYSNAEYVVPMRKYQNEQKPGHENVLKIAENEYYLLKDDDGTPYNDNIENYKSFPRSKTAEFTNAYVAPTASIPVVIDVKSFGKNAPGTKTFKFEVYTEPYGEASISIDDMVGDGNVNEPIIAEATVEGEGKFERELFVILPEGIRDNTFYVRMVDEGDEYWVYDKIEYMMYRYIPQNSLRATYSTGDNYNWNIEAYDPIEDKYYQDIESALFLADYYNDDEIVKQEKETIKVVIDLSKDEEEANPNTGAPVFE